MDDSGRVRDLIRAEILANHYQQEQLPSEAELMLAYGVGRNLIRDALDLLRSEGLIERIQGSGTFVIKTKIRHNFERFHAVHDEMQNPRRAGGRITAMATVVAPRPVATQLELAAGSLCTMLQYRLTIGSVPFTIATAYVPSAIGQRLAAVQFQGNFLAYLNAAGLSIGRADMSVEAVVADETVSEAMEISVGEPVLLFHRRLYGVDGTPLETGFVRCRGDGLILNMTLPVTPDAD